VHRPRPSRELIFVDRLPALGEDSVGIDLPEEVRSPEPSAQGHALLSLATYFRRHERTWRREFIDWLGGANVKNASLGWWAHTASAKNFLSSPLANCVFQTLALQKLLEETQAVRVYVAGASRGQIAALSGWLKTSGEGWSIADRHRRARSYWTILRLVYQVGRVLFAFVLRRPRKRPIEPGRVLLFTYVDRGFQDGRDAFFGKLAERLRTRLDKEVLHVAFIHSPFLETLPKLEQVKEFEYWPLFCELRAADLLWALARSLGAWARISKWPLPAALEGLNLRALLEEALRWDLAKGGYFYNLLVYRAAIRMTRRLRPERVIYPFENKSLEKMLLLGVRSADSGVVLVGYQHTSVTPRHTTLLFAKGEAAATPLPGRVITTGEVARRYLEENGRYLSESLVTGGALRQVWREPYTRPDPMGRPLRVLLALSSSRQELREAILVLRDAMELGARIELGIRPHPEFPLQTLPIGLERWAAANAKNLAGTSLQDNLEWCDVAVYVSSTVALEALMVGRPVINVRLSDPIDPDPLIGSPPLRFYAATSEELLAALRSITELPQAEYLKQREDAIAYVKSYLTPFSDQHVDLFLR